MGKYLNIDFVNKKSKLKRKLDLRYMDYLCARYANDRENSLVLADGFAHKLAKLTGFYDVQSDR